jgi:hypothetical protein
MRFEDRVQDYVGTLLHEMIHAFISIYSQRGDGYCPDRGYTGHGLAWQFIAHAAEQAVGDPKLLGLQLNLGRGTSLYLEMYVTEEYSGVTGLDGPGQLMDPERWGFKRIDEEKKKELRILFAGDITKELQQKEQNTAGVRWLSYISLAPTRVILIRHIAVGSHYYYVVFKDPINTRKEGASGRFEGLSSRKKIFRSGLLKKMLLK